MFVEEQIHKQRLPKWKQQGFDSPEEARQYRRYQDGTNGRRQRSRRNDYESREPISAKKLLQLEERRAKEKRAFSLGDTVLVQVAPDWMQTAEIVGAFVSGGSWIFETDCAYKRSVSQAELLTINTRTESQLIDDARALASEREQVLALKRGSRRRNLRR